MKLNSISASRFETFEGCTARYKAEYEDRTPRSENGGPADIGTACHGALEDYVREVYYNKTHEPDLDRLLAHYHKYYMEIFRSADKKDERYVDGAGMLKGWFKRTDLSNVEVISMEKKSSIEIKTKDGVKPYNYIWDRCDRFTEDGKTIVRVVDYKSYRKNMGPKDVRNKLQFRMYAVAAMVEFKDMAPDEIWIQADMLRYGTIEVQFSVEECREEYRRIVQTANMIIDLQAKDVEEIISPGCMYCVRKATCETLGKNIAGGGTYSLADDPDELADALYRLENQKKAAGYAADEIKKILMARAESEDLSGWETSNYQVEMTSRGIRDVNTREVALITGPEVFRSMAKVNVGSVEKLIKSGELGEEKTEQLRGVFTKSYGDPKPQVKPKGA